MPFNHHKLPTSLHRLLFDVGLGAVVGALSGASSAIFLLSLNAATSFREQHPWLLFLLPIGGIAIVLLYETVGKQVSGGNNLLLERVHDAADGVIGPLPFRMAPLILLTTVITHLFGGSAGREGTAVQMGGTLAGLLQKPLNLSPAEYRRILLTGISGGFGSVFGTPLAGSIFAVEVAEVGRAQNSALFPCFVSAVVGDIVCRLLGATHHVYVVGSIPSLTPMVWFWIVVMGVLSALSARLFVWLTEFIAHQQGKWVKWSLLRPIIGGLLVIAFTLLLGTRDYLGLSLPLLEKAFVPHSVPLWAFVAKIVFTAVTLGSGFKGGEVTPLFGIGATLGAAIAQLSGQQESFFAALGFVAVFAGASKTPLACALMGIELFGAPLSLPLMAVCLIAFALSGRQGIYRAQRWML